jgi:hypothetical protein
MEESEPTVSSAVKLWHAGVPLAACALDFGTNAATLEGTAEIELTGAKAGKKWLALFGPLWLVEGSPFAEGESAKSELVNAEPETAYVFSVASIGFSVSCEKFTVTGVKLLEATEGAAAASVEKISFEKCAVVKPAGCLVAATLTTAPIKVELFDEGTTEVWALFKPEVGETFITVSVSECSDEGKYAVAGTACTSELEPGTDAVEKLWEAGVPLVGCAMKIGANAVTFTGEGAVKLTGPKSGSTWSGMF